MPIGEFGEETNVGIPPKEKENEEVKIKWRSRTGDELSGTAFVFGCGGRGHGLGFRSRPA